nr:unnamed protein product [Digitaria exilis]
MVKVAPDVGHDGRGDGDGGNDIIWMGTGCDGAADPSWSTAVAARVASAAVGDGNGSGGSEGRCRRRSRMPASWWLRLRTAVVNCAGVMTKLPVAAVDPVGTGSGGEDEATIARLDDGGGSGMEVVGGGGVEVHRWVSPGGIDAIREPKRGTRSTCGAGEDGRRHHVIVDAQRLSLATRRVFVRSGTELHNLADLAKSIDLHGRLASIKWLGNSGVILILFETPTGFALLNHSKVKLFLPNAIEVLNFVISLGFFINVLSCLCHFPPNFWRVVNYRKSGQILARRPRY